MLVVESVTLDGRVSVDPDGDALHPHWSLLHRPPESSAVLDDPERFQPGFTADRLGAYVAQLLVDDARLQSGPDTVVVEAVEPVNRAPRIDSSAPAEAHVGSEYLYATPPGAHVQFDRPVHDFRTGERNNPVMMPMAKNLTGDEIAAVSAYYAAMPVPATVTEFPAVKVAKTAMDLVEWGDWTERGLPACVQCHAPNGNGIGSHFPGISGQHAGYLKAQLQAWKTGTRANDRLGMMKAVANKLTDAKIDALATYYASRPGAAPIPAENAPTPDRVDVQVAAAEVHSGEVAQQGAPPAGCDAGTAGDFQSPTRDALPDGPFGEVIRQGQAIFENANAHTTSSSYVGNDQAECPGLGRGWPARGGQRHHCLADCLQLLAGEGSTDR